MVYIFSTFLFFLEKDAILGNEPTVTEPTMRPMYTVDDDGVLNIVSDSDDDIFEIISKTGQAKGGFDYQSNNDGIATPEILISVETQSTEVSSTHNSSQQ